MITALLEACNEAKRGRERCDQFTWLKQHLSLPDSDLLEDTEIPVGGEVRRRLLLYSGTLFKVCCSGSLNPPFRPLACRDIFSERVVVNFLPVGTVEARAGGISVHRHVVTGPTGEHDCGGPAGWQLHSPHQTR